MPENFLVLRHMQNNFAPLEFSSALLHASCSVKIQLAVVNYFHSPSSNCAGREKPYWQRLTLLCSQPVLGLKVAAAASGLEKACKPHATSSIWLGVTFFLSSFFKMNLFSPVLHANVTKGPLSPSRPYPAGKHVWHSNCKRKNFININ